MQAPTGIAFVQEAKQKKEMEGMGYVIYSIYVLSTLWLLATALVQLRLLWHAKKRSRRTTSELGQLPFVTIQVPVYNEKYVIADLLYCLSKFDYPVNLFEIQVLDDSTDETSCIIDQLAKHVEQKGIAISVVRRKNRTGYKAGALQHGLSLCKGDYIAIFDADFQPSPSFLRDMLPHFMNEKVGLVQARWGHLNRGQNFLTQIQTYLLDMHFQVEQAGRYKAGHFINFCGTAGVWRKQCIIDAGGWDGEVLSEDLDLSYRAQLKGWKIVYDESVEVPAQLPSVIEAFKIQQFRWTKGIAQTARKSLGKVFSMPVSFRKKIHAAFHLLGSFTFVCLLVNALLTVPLLQLRNHYPVFIDLTNYTVIGAFNMAALGYLYYASTPNSPKKGLRFLTYYPLFLVVYLAMSVQNAIAVIQGFAGMKSAFHRTPKFNTQAAITNHYFNRKSGWMIYVEAAIFFYFIYGIGMSFYYGDFFLLFFFVLMCSGLMILVYQSLPTFTIKKFQNFSLARLMR
ncbi:MAG: glycosyltransferase [Chitinophagaceae bacterium]|nr:MAG: glycosyltransferase [Chitinophagaceae bacterium]